MERLTPMCIETQSPRLILRELSEENCTKNYVNWLRDPAVSRFLETRWQQEQTLDSVIAYVRDISGRPNEILFGIFLKDGQRHIGNIKVGPIHPQHAVADVSLFIGEKDCWGSGYATEAIAAVSRLAFDELTVQKLSASTFQSETGEVYYKATISLSRDTVGTHGATYRITPGMVVQADIVTGAKSLVRYMLKPVYSSLDTAFTER